MDHTTPRLAENDVLALIARHGAVARGELASWEQRAAERLVAAGVLRVSWEAVDWTGCRHGGPPQRKVYYDPRWQPPDYGQGLRLVRGGRA